MMCYLNLESTGKILFISWMIILLSGCGEEQTVTSAVSTLKEEYLDSIAKKYGAGQWEQVDTIRFTYVYSGKDTIAKRHWQWLPQENQVTFIPYALKDSNKNEMMMDGDTVRKVTYQTTQWNRNDRHLIDIDRYFVNDRFWLLLPLHLVWDNVKMTLTDSVRSPVSDKMLGLLIIKYEQDAIHDPGDVYELYFNDTFLIEASTYKFRGSKENAISYEWKDYHRFGPLLIATVFQNKEATFKILLEDIEVGVQH